MLKERGGDAMELHPLSEPEDDDDDDDLTLFDASQQKKKNQRQYRVAVPRGSFITHFQKYVSWVNWEVMDIESKLKWNQLESLVPNLNEIN